MKTESIHLGFKLNQKSLHIKDCPLNCFVFFVSYGTLNLNILLNRPKAYKPLLCAPNAFPNPNITFVKVVMTLSLCYTRSVQKSRVVEGLCWFFHYKILSKNYRKEVDTRPVTLHKCVPRESYTPSRMV